MDVWLWSKPNYPNVRLNLEVLLTDFFGCNGIVHHECLPLDRTLKIRNTTTLKLYAEAVRQKRTELWKNQSWILHHDNALAHISMLVQRTWCLLTFSTSGKLKTAMKGKRFATIEEIKEKSKLDLLVIPKSSFQKLFEDLKKRWHKYIITEGGYFEGTK